MNNQSPSVPTEEVVDLSPFKRLVMTIGTLPTAFTESMTYYEALAYFVKYLEETVVPAINQNAQATEELQTLFTQLKDYVDNYFEELDVQEEINNKLDEMAESGQLEELIAQYLSLSSVLAFNTVADMVAGENLVDGSFTQTYGFYSLNDGGGAKYKIRTVTNQDVEDGQQIIRMNDTSLVAELIKSEPINVKQCGVHGDGETDDTALIQNLIDTNGLKTLYFPEGEYLISEPLTIRSANADTINLTLDENAVIKTNTTIDSLIEIGHNSTGTYDRYAKGSILTICGGILDAAHTTQAIKIWSNRKQTVVKDLTIINISNYGIYTDIGSDTSSSTDNVFDNLSINGEKTASNTVGIYLNANDDKLTHIRINGCRTAIYCGRAGHTFEDIHPLGSWSTNQPTVEEYEATKGIVFAGGGEYMLTDIYLDTMGRGLVFANANQTIMINNLFCFWWLYNASYTTKIIEQTAVGYQRFFINNIDITLPAQGTFKGIDLSGTNSNYRTMLPSFESYQLSNLRIANPGLMDINDYLFCQQLYKNEVTYNKDWWQYQMTANSYYPIARVKNACSMKIQMNNDQVIEATINPASNFIQVRNIADMALSNTYTLALCNAANDGDGTAVADLCIKATAQRPLNVTLSGYKTGIAQTFLHRGYPSGPLTNPTVNAEVSFNPV